MTNKEFSDKYCKMCSSLVCAGINDELARDGCRHYQKEILGKEKDDLEELFEEIIKKDYTKMKMKCVHCSIEFDIKPYFDDIRITTITSYNPFSAPGYFAEAKAVAICPYCGTKVINQLKEELTSQNIIDFLIEKNK